MAREEAKSEVSEWVEKACTRCGLLYPQRKSYEKQCPVCFKLDKGYTLLWGDLALLWAQEKIVALQAELLLKEKKLQAPPKQEVLPLGAIPVMSLLRLCHPDKHGGSEEATEITKKLLALRKK